MSLYGGATTLSPRVRFVSIGLWIYIYLYIPNGGGTMDAQTFVYFLLSEFWKPYILMAYLELHQRASLLSLGVSWVLERIFPPSSDTSWFPNTLCSLVDACKQIILNFCPRQLRSRYRWKIIWIKFGFMKFWKSDCRQVRLFCLDNAIGLASSAF